MQKLLTPLFLLFLLVTGGYAEEVKHVDAKQAIALLKEEKPPIVLDVRTAEEYAEGHISGAKNIDFNKPDFAEQLGKLDKETSYLVHCRSGGRSGKSLAVLKKLGFKSIIHLDGGMLAWEEAGGKVEK